jgi:ABC-type transporter Mla subunit MlaD
VGALVVVSLLVLLAITISIGNFETYFADTLPIYIKVPSAVGLDPYTQVTFSGVKIGQVVQINYDEELDMAVICAEIDRSSPVATDSEARFTSASLLSNLFIEISGGSDEKKIKHLLEEGEVDPEDEKIYIEAEPYISIGEVFALASDVKGALQKIEELADELKPALRSAQGFVESVSVEFTDMLDEMDDLFVESKPIVVDLLENSNGMILAASQEMIPAIQTVRSGADRISKTLPRVVDHIDKNLADILDEAEGLIKSVSPEMKMTMVTLRESIESLQTRMTNIESHLIVILENANQVVEENRDEIERIMIRMEDTSANLELLSRQLAKDPWRLIWKSEGKKDPNRVSPEWNPLDQ